MIEELTEYLQRYGWAEATADDIHDAYANATGSPEDQRAAVRLAAAWMDDSEHDYSGEVVGCIRRWQYEVGARPWPFQPGDATIVGYDTDEDCPCEEVAL